MVAKIQLKQENLLAGFKLFGRNGIRVFNIYLSRSNGTQTDV